MLPSMGKVVWSPKSTCRSSKPATISIMMPIKPDSSVLIQIGFLILARK